MGVRDAVAKALANRIKVFHSSPHDFDRPSLDKIGTGQGAASYSPGFYVAESPKVSGQGGEYWNEFLRKFEGSPEGNAAKRLRDAGFDRNAAVVELERQIAEIRARYAGLDARDPAFTGTDGYNKLVQQGEATLKRLEDQRDMIAGGRAVGPRTYEMEITTPRSSFLDWDKPLDQQPTKVWDRLHPDVRSSIDEAMENRGTNAMSDALDDFSGRDLYNALRHHDISDSLPAEVGRSSAYRGDYDPALHAAEYLKSLDIPGVTYLDAVSRKRGNEVREAQRMMQLEQQQRPGGYGADAWGREIARLKEGEPLTSNYSVWDTDKLEVLKKYGIPGAGALPLMGELAAPDQYEVQQ